MRSLLEAVLKAQLIAAVLRAVERQGRTYAELAQRCGAFGVGKGIQAG